MVLPLLKTKDRKKKRRIVSFSVKQLPECIGKMILTRQENRCKTTAETVNPAPKH